MKDKPNTMIEAYSMFAMAITDLSDRIRHLFVNNYPSINPYLMCAYNESEIIVETSYGEDNPSLYNVLDGVVPYMPEKFIMTKNEIGIDLCDINKKTTHKYNLMTYYRSCDGFNHYDYDSDTKTGIIIIKSERNSERYTAINHNDLLNKFMLLCGSYFFDEEWVSYNEYSEVDKNYMLKLLLKMQPFDMEELLYEALIHM